MTAHGIQLPLGTDVTFDDQSPIPPLNDITRFKWDLSAGDGAMILDLGDVNNVGQNGFHYDSNIELRNCSFTANARMFLHPGARIQFPGTTFTFEWDGTSSNMDVSSLVNPLYNDEAGGWGVALQMHDELGVMLTYETTGQGNLTVYAWDPSVSNQTTVKIPKLASKTHVMVWKLD